MKNSCKNCGGKLILTSKHGIGSQTYKCEKCGIYYFNGNKHKQIIIKDSIKYYNINQ